MLAIPDEVDIGQKISSQVIVHGHLFRVLIFGVIIHQLRRSKHRGGGFHVALPRDIGVEDFLTVCRERLLDYVALARQQIDAKFVS